MRSLACSTLGDVTCGCGSVAWGAGVVSCAGRAGFDGVWSFDILFSRSGKRGHTVGLRSIAQEREVPISLK